MFEKFLAFWRSLFSPIFEPYKIHAWVGNTSNAMLPSGTKLLYPQDDRIGWSKEDRLSFNSIECELEQDLLPHQFGFARVYELRLKR